MNTVDRQRREDNNSSCCSEKVVTGTKNWYEDVLCALTLLALHGRTKGATRYDSAQGQTLHPYLFQVKYQIS